MDQHLKSLLNERMISSESYNKEEFSRLIKKFQHAGFHAKANNTFYQLAKLIFRENFKDYILIKKLRFEEIEVDRHTYNAIHITKNKYLVYSSIRNYKGDVPEQILDLIIEAGKDSNISNLKIAFVADKHQIPSLTKGRTIPKDPIIIGELEEQWEKLIMKLRKELNVTFTYIGCPYAILVGIWGTDIEDINSVFERERTK